VGGVRSLGEEGLHQVEVVRPGLGGRGGGGVGPTHGSHPGKDCLKLVLLLCSSIFSWLFLQ